MTGEASEAVAAILDASRTTSQEDRAAAIIEIDEAIEALREARGVLDEGKEGA